MAGNSQADGAGTQTEDRRTQREAEGGPEHSDSGRGEGRRPGTAEVSVVEAEAGGTSY